MPQIQQRTQLHRNSSEALLPRSKVEHVSKIQ